MTGLRRPPRGSGAFCDDEDANGEDETGDDATDENEPDRRRSGPEGPATGSGPQARRSNRGSRVETLVIIDAEALRRGTTQGDELCEIEGIGPVSVAAGVELLGEGALRFVVKEGFDIKTVTRCRSGHHQGGRGRARRAGPDLLCPGLWQAARTPT